MELDAAIWGRRMCRSFVDEPVSAETLERALELATHAPSAGNTQGWAFLVLNGESRDTFWRHAAD
ncbi:MAG TPA: nitroreductase family protein, partial [Acidimicrobiales bacterium]|nr:nitroreductase family protein [Acidimicrobiales bacterium]